MFGEERTTISRSRPVALIHGFAGSAARTWTEAGWFELLREAGRTTIGVDLLGHGNAEKPTDPAEYAAVGDHALNQLPLGPVDVIAFSAGARLTLQLAASHPERFGRIVCGGIGGNLLERQDDDRHAAIAAAIRAGDQPEHAFLRHLVNLCRLPGNDPEALAAFFEHRPDPLDAETLARVDSPVLIAAGDRDEAAGDPTQIAELIPGAESIVLRRTEHEATPKSFDFLDNALAFIGAVP